MGWTAWTEFVGTTGTACATFVAGGKLYVFANGLDDKKIYVRSRSANWGAWSGWSEFGGTSDAPLSAVAFDGEYHFFAKGLNDHKIYVRSTKTIPGNKVWKELGGTTDAAVSAVVFGDKLYVFAKGEKDNKIYYLSRGKGGSWSQWRELGGTTDAAITTVVFNDELFVFAKGVADNQVYVLSLVKGGSWSAWRSVGGATNRPIAAVVFGRDLHLFAKGLVDKHLYSLIVGRNNAWSPWFPVPPVAATTDAAVAAVRFDNTLHLFAKGIGDKKIYTQSMAIYELPFDDDGKWVWGRGNWDEAGGGHGQGDQIFDFDFNHPVGGNVRAARDGRVVFLDDNEGNSNVDSSVPGYGTAVHIEHADGSTAAYIHLKSGSLKVKCQQQVKKGKIIAQSGHTGASHAPHLHFGIHSFTSFENNCLQSVPPAVNGPHVPVYFKDKNHVDGVWRPAQGDPLASSNS